MGICVFMHVPDLFKVRSKQGRLVCLHLTILHRFAAEVIVQLDGTYRGGRLLVHTALCT
jgi:hypothetical protein